MYLFTFTKEIFELKLHFLCSEHHKKILIKDCLWHTHTKKQFWVYFLPGQILENISFV